MTALAARLTDLQGLYYVVTGGWPLVSMRTFQIVTGPKTDRWLVRTVSLLLILIGGVLASAGRERRLTPEVRALGAGTAASLAAIDLAYGIPGRISRIYVVEALVELAFIAAWWATRDPSRTRRASRPVVASRVG